MNKSLQLSQFQTRALLVPEEHDLFLGGGRGGGKSYSLALLALRHASQYGEKARVLYLRRTYAGLRDFELVLREIFGTVFGDAAKYNQTEGVWRLPGGGHIELSQLDDHAAYNRFQGRSISLLLVDEAGQWSDPGLLDMMRSNLRSASGIPVRVAMAGNPGGPGHAWLARRFVFTAKPWTAFLEPKSKRQWVYAPSTYRENEHIDKSAYADQLASACPDDAELLRAWSDGDWSIARGAFFASALEESRNAVDPWKTIPQGWDTWIAHDWGSSAPSCTLLFAKSPGATHEGKFYPRDSLVVVDELAAVRRDSLNTGLGWSAATTAEAIREFVKPWGVKPVGVADDACWSNGGHSTGSIADEFARGGVRFQPAKKAARIAGWQMMRRLLADAGQLDKPGLYVSRACAYFWATVPYLARDQKRVEDVDSSGNDHAADAARYGILRMRRSASVEPFPLL